MIGFKKTLLVLGDVGVLYLSLALTLIIRYPLDTFNLHLGDHVYPFSLIFILWLFVFYLSDLYREHGGGVNLLKRLSGTVLISGLVSVIAFYLFGQFFELTPKVNLAIFSIVFLVLDYLWRILIINIFTAGAVKILLLGDAPLLDEIEKYLAENPQAGYQVSEHIRNTEKIDAIFLSEVIKEKKIGAVIIQPSITKDFSGLKAVFRLLPLEVNLENARDFYELLFEKVPLRDLDENWFIEKIPTRRPFYDASKRLVDVLLSAILGIVFLPFGIIFAILVKATTPGPAILKQERVGKNDNVLSLYKFRTMTTWRGGNDGTPAWTEENDSRITSFGKFLRFTHLDEIPQLWNILRGDISFTGPRPERVELAEKFKKFPYYEIRHIIKPGLSGWAQIKYKPSASLEEAYEKLRYDIYYVKNRSFFLDFVIILRTIRYVFTSHR
jgi:exopolysaccharide biosynthesis polyprenyl glycosylphosphotransferase